MTSLSYMVNCKMEVHFFIAFIIQRPASTNFEVEYAYPRWGLESVIREWKHCLYFSNLGKAVLMITPPIECPSMQIVGQTSYLEISYYISAARRMPMFSISPSVLPQLDVEIYILMRLSQYLRSYTLIFSISRRHAPRPCTITTKI